jgi:hypothetical protein
MPAADPKITISPEAEKLNENRQRQMELFLKIHTDQVERLEERTNKYAFLVINILCTFNGGSIIALLSFIGSRTNKANLSVGIGSISAFGFAFLLVIAALVFGFFFNASAHKSMALAKLDFNKPGYAEQEALNVALKKANGLRSIGISAAICSLAFSIAGCVSFLTYLLGQAIGPSVAH